MLALDCLRPYTEHRSPPTKRVRRLIDEIPRRKVAKSVELGSIIMKKWGMKESLVIGVMKPKTVVLARMTMKASTRAAKEEKKPEKTVFELKLESYEASSKIKIIKEMGSVTDLGLKDVKDMVEKTPAVFKK